MIGASLGSFMLGSGPDPGRVIKEVGLNLGRPQPCDKRSRRISGIGQSRASLFGSDSKKSGPRLLIPGLIPISAIPWENSGSLLQDLLAAKGAIVAGWIVLALALEQWRPAAPPPIHLAGYGAAWFTRWGRNLGFFILNGALSTLFVLPVTVWAALHAPWSRAELVGCRRAALGLAAARHPAARVLDLLVAPRQPRMAVPVALPRGASSRPASRRHHRAALPFRRGGLVGAGARRSDHGASPSR